MNKKKMYAALALALSLGTIQIVPVHAALPAPSPTVGVSLANSNITPQPVVLVYLFAEGEVCGGIIWGEGEVYDIAGEFLGVLTPSGLLIRNGQVVGCTVGA
jgi:hypothetical protein